MPSGRIFSEFRIDDPDITDADCNWQKLPEDLAALLTTAAPSPPPGRRLFPSYPFVQHPPGQRHGMENRFHRRPGGRQPVQRPIHSRRKHRGRTPGLLYRHDSRQRTAYPLPERRGPQLQLRKTGNSLPFPGGSEKSLRGRRDRLTTRLPLKVSPKRRRVRHFAFYNMNQN